MKKKYETPIVKKLEFNYSEMVTASGGKTHASKGPAKCGSDGKTHASKGPAMCN